MLTSTRSPHVARLRRLHERKGRQQSGTFLAEGPDCVAAALDAGWVREVVAEPGHYLAVRAMQAGVSVHEAESRVIAAICDTKTAQGVVAECDLPNTSSKQVFSAAGQIVVCEGLADPGNLGTIIRTAEAVGASGVLTTQGSVDLWNPKVVRASAGSIFRIPVVQMVSAAEAMQLTRQSGWTSVALAAQATNTVFDLVTDKRRAGDDLGRIAWIVGSEAHGIDEDTARSADERARIPMSPTVESLNAAIAVAVCLYAVVSAVASE